MPKKVFSLSKELKQDLDDTISAAQNHAGQLNIAILPLRLIELDPDNPRELLISIKDVSEGLSQSDPDYLIKLEEKNSLSSLAESIKGQGLINPILVYRHLDKYILVAGE